MTKEALKLALEALKQIDEAMPFPVAKLAQAAIKEALANDTSQERVDEIEKQRHEPVAWKYDVTYNQDGTVSVALPNGDELRIVLPNQQEPYCWTWDVWVSGGKWRAEYGWEKPTEKVVNLQPLYTAPPQRKPMTGQMTKQMRESCDSYEMRGAFVDGWLSAEAAHGIKGEA